MTQFLVLVLSIVLGTVMVLSAVVIASLRFAKWALLAYDPPAGLRALPPTPPMPEETVQAAKEHIIQLRAGARQIYAERTSHIAAQNFNAAEAMGEEAKSMRQEADDLQLRVTAAAREKEAKSKYQADRDGQLAMRRRDAEEKMRNKAALDELLAAGHPREKT